MHAPLVMSADHLPTERSASHILHTTTDPLVWLLANKLRLSAVG